MAVIAILFSAVAHTSWILSACGLLAAEATGEPTQPFYRLPPPTRAAVFIALLGLVLLGLLLIALVMIGARWVRRNAKNHPQQRNFAQPQEPLGESDVRLEPLTPGEVDSSSKTVHGDPTDDTRPDYPPN